MRNIPIKKIGIWIASLVMLWAVISAVQIWCYGKIDSKQSSDAIIVLGAGTDGTEPSPVFRERLNHGIWLYQNGYGEKLILTGGYSEGNEWSDARIASEYVQSLGVPAEDILLEEKSVITQENIQYAKEIMDAHQINTAILVSDPLHMKRAMLMAEDYGVAACSSPTPTTMYQTMKTKLPFLARETFFYMGYQIFRIFAGK